MFIRTAKFCPITGPSQSVVVVSVRHCSPTGKGPVGGSVSISRGPERGLAVGPKNKDFLGSIHNTIDG